MLSGHMHTSSDGEGQRDDLGDSGNTIYSLLSDYQDFPSGGNGYLLLLRFDPAGYAIDLETYSPTLDSFRTGGYDPTSLVYDMDGTSSAAFTELGTVTGVASGASATPTWADRVAGTEHEWYAVVSDGTQSTTGATWSFTAGTPNTAPVLDAIGNHGVDELVELAFTATATDADLPANTLSFSLEGAPTGAGIDSAPSGPSPVTYTVWLPLVTRR